MTDALKNKCGQFIQNRDTIKNSFRWENAYMFPLCAEIYTSKGKLADSAALKSCVELLKQKAGFFSNFRSIAKLPIAAMLDVSGAPEAVMENSLTVYRLLKNEFFTSSHLPLVAMIIAQLSRPSEYERIALRTRALYNLMKSRHPFLTSSEDSAFAALLALSQLSDERMIAEAEDCYERLRPNFFLGNAVQSLSLVLALCEGSPDEKSRRVMGLFSLLKEQGHRYGTGYELPTLGVLAVSSGDLNDAAEKIIEIDAFLSQQKGFGAFGIGKKQRLMYACILAQDECPDNRAMQTAAINGTIAMIVAQQAAMCAAVAASNAAAAGAASSS